MSWPVSSADRGDGMPQKFYITTPIYYVNAEPHIGHAYTTIVADVLARWHRLGGARVFFLTGTDEHGEKVQRAAEAAGQTPRQFCDRIAGKFRDAWKALDIRYDHFIRTTDPAHVAAVQRALTILHQNGHIYKGTYRGLYCVGCERYLTPSELVDGRCPDHLTEPKIMSEESYFFRLSAFQQALLRKIESGEMAIGPEARKNEVLSFLKKNRLEDISISRSKVTWGIPLPWDPTKTAYVWMDAFLNYITGIGWPDKRFARHWPADLHLIGKDILRVHTTIWPAELLAIGLETPRRFFAHGYFTIGGQKMSKSLGNVVDPVALAEKYPVDAVRYFLIREFPLGEDGDFSGEALRQRMNGELVSDLGNLVSRVLALCEKNSTVKIEGEPILENKLNLKKISSHMEKLELHHAVDEIFNVVRACNAYINQTEPWKKKGKELGNILYNLVEGLRIIAILISPFMPATAENITSQLGVRPGMLKDAKFRKFSGKPKKGPHLFEKMDPEK